ncbi:uncharacterized protein LOC111299915 isoform X2 [Durio zibethinus]|uniref:Uncharacterized protein LOC111299915 isoform X2 n=1 Tax=Durio zibethinus TaxID=66656 RepID=A0A6P5ZEG7_DURZI|nr:uncharacterized protein LOC111299915 isoform X2 [Durio zibethinus]
MNRLDVESWQSRPHLPRSILRERTGWMGVFGEVARRSNFPELSCFCLLETQLPRPPDEEKNNHLIECGISYAQYLSIVEVQLIKLVRIKVAVRLSTACA